MVISLAVVLFASGLGWHISSQPEASGEQSCRPIDKLPFHVRQSGRFCISSDLTALDTGLTVEADAVTIDLQGFRISGPTGQDTSSIGIYGRGVDRLKVVNGRIDGFGVGIAIASRSLSFNNGFHMIDGVTVCGSRQRGIAVIGYGSEVRNSKICNIGGDLPPSVHTHGLALSGSAAVIRNNHFHEIRGRSSADEAEGIAIALSGSINGAIVKDNVFTNDSALSVLQHPDGYSPSTYAIWVGGFGIGNVVIENNMISNFVNGIVFDTHIGGIVARNVITDTPAPIALREPPDPDYNRDLAGADGYRPTREGQRPAGLKSALMNDCSIGDAAWHRIAGLREVQLDCLADRDISLNELIAIIPPSN